MKFCYLLGYPLSHSLSAVMHNAAFQKLGLKFTYESRPVKPEFLDNFISTTLRNPEAKGANVTIPHKSSALTFLDDVEIVAEKIGAVNTIVNYDGHLKGYNTDGLAALRSLKESFGSLNGIKAVVLGAGGASKAITYHLSMIADEIVVINRSLERAEALVNSLLLCPECTAYVHAHSLRNDLVKQALEGADLLINATPVGMKPNEGETPVEKSLLDSSLFVFDTVYNPLQTKLLIEAEAAGAKTLSGVKMLVYQGVEAFKLWTGIAAPEALMKRVVEESLGFE